MPGWKRTLTITCAPGAMTVPSGSAATAANALAAGGLDFRIASGVPPALPTVKLSVTDWPSATIPKSSRVGLMVICAGGAARPVTGTSALPTSVCNVSWPVNVWTKSPTSPAG